jgi:S1-C subfamily serine protease
VARRRNAVLGLTLGTLAIAAIVSSGARLRLDFEPTPAYGKGTVSFHSLSNELVEVSEKVLPSVVSVDAIQVISGYRYPIVPSPFAPFSEDGLQSPEQRVPTVGSGLIIREDGYIVTNNHVVDGVQEIRVTLHDNRVAPATLVGRDAASDLAVLKVNLKGLPTLSWADNKNLKIGEMVLAVGDPFNMRGSVSHGIVSGKGRKDLGIADFEDFVQTDAAINPGNSGGPLVDLDANVVGINAAILTKSGGSQGIGLAIPAEVAKGVIDELITTGRVDRSWMGVFVQSVNDSIASQLGMNRALGVVVTGGYRTGPAGRAGFQRFDVILDMNGTIINDDRTLRSLLAQTPVGKPVTFQIWRKGKMVRLKVVTETRPLDSTGRVARGV